MIDELMSAIATYGPAALAVALAINCFGLPFPTSLLMLANGALAKDGDADLATLAVAGIVGAVAGDQAGYWLARLGGGAIAARLAGRIGAAGALAKAEAFSKRWGVAGVFATRWLLSPLGPYVNLAAGAARMPWLAFTLPDLAGEALWVVLYLSLGWVFADSVAAVSEILGNATWFLAAGLVTAAIGIALYRTRRNAGTGRAPAPDTAAPVQPNLRNSLE